jgi:hypothetical protein
MLNGSRHQFDSEIAEIHHMKDELVSLVSHLVDGDRHVTRLYGTRIHVAIVFRNEVNVVENKTLERILFECLDKGNVHDACLVERVVAVLQESKTSENGVI